MSKAPTHTEIDTPDGLIRLTRPRDYARAIAIQRIGQQEDEPVIAMAAALGLCWQAGTSDKKPKAQWVKCRGVWRYGESILNELIGRGWGIANVMVAGQKALPIVVGMLHDMIGEDEVKTAEGFTVAAEGASP